MKKRTFFKVERVHIIPLQTLQRKGCLQISMKHYKFTLTSKKHTCLWNILWWTPMSWMWKTFFKSEKTLFFAPYGHFYTFLRATSTQIQWQTTKLREGQPTFFFWGSKIHSITKMHYTKMLLMLKVQICRKLPHLLLNCPCRTWALYYQLNSILFTPQLLLFFCSQN